MAIYDFKVRNQYGFSFGSQKYEKKSTAKRFLREKCFSSRFCDSVIQNDMKSLANFNVITTFAMYRGF